MLPIGTGVATARTVGVSSKGGTCATAVNLSVWTLAQPITADLAAGAVAACAATIVAATFTSIANWFAIALTLAIYASFAAVLYIDPIQTAINAAALYTGVVFASQLALNVTLVDALFAGDALPVGAAIFTSNRCCPFQASVGTYRTDLHIAAITLILVDAWACILAKILTDAGAILATVATSGDLGPNQASVAHGACHCVIVQATRRPFCRAFILARWAVDASAIITPV